MQHLKLLMILSDRWYQWTKCWLRSKKYCRTTKEMKGDVILYKRIFAFYFDGGKIISRCQSPSLWQIASLLIVRRRCGITYSYDVFNFEGIIWTLSCKPFADPNPMFLGHFSSHERERKNGLCSWKGKIDVCRKWDVENIPDVSYVKVKCGEANAIRRW